MFKSETRHTCQQPVSTICRRVRTKLSKGKMAILKPVSTPPAPHSNAHVMGAYRGVGGICRQVYIYIKNIYKKQRLTTKKPVDNLCLQVSTSSTGYFQANETAQRAFAGAERNQ